MQFHGVKKSTVLDFFVFSLELENLLKHLEKKLQLVKVDMSLQKITKPTLFFGTLRDEFQATGAKWLDDIMCNERYGILADEMGLGKTVQTIHAITARISDDPLSKFLVVVPRSLMATWMKEFKKFAPRLPVVYFPANENADEIVREKILRQKDLWNVALITDYLVDVHLSVSSKGDRLKLLFLIFQDLAKI